MKTIDCQQYSREWWEARRGIATASAFDRIATPAKGDYSTQAEGYACQLIADRFDRWYGCTEDYVSAAMKNGTIMEPEARNFYELKRDYDVVQVGFCLADDGRLGCSPDGLVGDHGGLELKSPTLSTHVKYLYDGVLPTKYKPQVHGCLIVTGRAWWDFMSYAPGLPPLLVRVEPDEYTQRLRDTLAQFLADYDRILEKIESQLPPPPEPQVLHVPGFAPVEVPEYVSPY